jgi:hypothetical protein
LMSLKLVLVLFIICFEVSAAFALPTLNFSAVSTVGTTASFTITLTNSVGTSISGISTDIKFNPLVFKLQKNASGDVINIAAGAAATSAGKQIYTSNPAPGVLRIGIVGLGVTPINNGPVAQVNFTVINPANTGNQIFTNSPGASKPDGSAAVIVGAGITTPPPAAINGVCGLSNGKSFSVVPITDFCAAGTASAVTGSGPWSWNCDGLYGGTNAGCTAAISPLNGVCGPSNGMSFTTMSSSTGGLCTSGTASEVTGTGPWKWSCDGANSGKKVDCTATVTYGFIRNSGVAELKDALFVLQSVVGSIKLTSAEQQRADMNGDGKVDVGDAILILAKVVGL